MIASLKEAWMLTWVLTPRVLTKVTLFRIGFVPLLSSLPSRRYLFRSSTTAVIQKRTLSACVRETWTGGVVWKAATTKNLEQQHNKFEVKWPTLFTLTGLPEAEQPRPFCSWTSYTCCSPGVTARATVGAAMKDWDKFVRSWVSKHGLISWAMSAIYCTIESKTKSMTKPHLWNTIGCRSREEWRVSLANWPLRLKPRRWIIRKQT